MDIAGKVKAEVARRVTVVNRDEKNETELEVRVTKQIEKSQFSRVLRYCRSHYPIHKPVEDSLDISQDRGSLRISVLDIGQIGRMCMSKNPSDVGSDALIISKEPLAQKIEIADYGISIAMKREVPVDDKETAIKSMFAGKRLQNYRLKRRYSFFAHDSLFSIDLTVVKQKIGANISILYNVPEQYEVEVELMAGSDIPRDTIVQKLFEVTAELLMVLNSQTSGELLKSSERLRILGEYYKLVALPDNLINRFIGPQPVTLERNNLVKGIEGNFDILDDYTVTEKADGKRALLFVNSLGYGYLLDMQLAPIVTDIYVPSAKSSILDGEIVTETKIGSQINKFLVFDAYFAKGRDIRNLRLIDFTGKLESRLSNAESLVSEMSSSTNPIVSVKKFYTRDKAPLILQKDRSGEFEYIVDGLIFTPANVGVFQNFERAPITRRVGAWGKVFKWKPEKDNSVDFKVVFDKTSKRDLIVSGNKLRARLLVGRMGIGSSGLVDAYSMLTGSYNVDAYELIEFDPPDYGIGEPASWFHPVPSSGIRDMPKCIQPPFETIEDESIVEFAWDVKSRTWRPLRIRHDKVKPNAYNTAIGVWRSIAFPVTIGDIVNPSQIKDIGPSGNDDVYFARETARDGSSSQAMRRFHGFWIKNKILLSNAAKYARVPGEKLKLFDIAVGEAGDLTWWIENKYDVVIGVDSVNANILGSNRGAYSRLSDAINNKKERSSLRYAFVTMTADKPIGPEAVSDIQDTSLRIVAENLWSVPEVRPDVKLKNYYGLANQKFDVVSLQFAIHYFFDEEARVDILLDNVDRYLRPGGLFLGTCLDAVSVDNAFRDAESDILQGDDEEGNIIWKLHKRYTGSLGKEGSVDNFGKQIDVYLETINKTTPEYLVDFELLTNKLAAKGIVPLSKKKVSEFGTKSSSELFETTFRAYDWDALVSSPDNRISFNAKLAGAMSSATKQYSFLNRWFVFEKQ